MQRCACREDKGNLFFSHLAQLITSFKLVTQAAYEYIKDHHSHRGVMTKAIRRRRCYLFI